MSAKAITCLLTGFDAFGKNKVNPTEIIVEAFPDLVKTKPSGPLRRAKEIHIEKRILPTAGIKGWKALKAALDHVVENSSGPIYVVMTGLANKRNWISLERFAINIKDYGLADNSGHQPLDKPISKNAPDLLRTKVDLAALNKAVTDLGYPSNISNHAGTFICNELYFQALHYATQQPKIKSIVFVHVPNEKDFALAAAKSKKKAISRAALAATTSKKQIQFLGQAIAEIVETACKLI
ncbi:pyroglutamyl-peptidase I [soil metagenome]